MKRTVLLVLNLVLLSAGLLYVAPAFAGLLVLGSGCPDGSRSICDPGLGEVLVNLPFWTFLAGLGLNALGGTWAVAQDRRIGPWVFASWALPVGAMFLGFMSAT